MSKKVTKAVIAAAGFGTRFLPQTKAMPKEMLPLIDKPIIQYVVEELVQAGVEDIIIVGSSNKRAIEDHFDMPNADLLANLKSGGAKKEPLIKEVESIGNLANFIYIRQKGPYGNATPLACAAHLFGENEPFIYSFADDFIAANPSRFAQMIKAYEEYGGGIFSCKKVINDKEYNMYGFVAGEIVKPGVIRMSNVIEKPGKKQAPSDLATVSSYLLPSNFLRYLESARKEHAGKGEFKLQPIVQTMIDDGHKFYGCEINNGVFYDTGDPLEYLKTVIDFGLSHTEYGGALRRHIKNKNL